MSIETRPLDIDPLTGRVRLFHYNHADDTFSIETIEDVESIVEQNKALQNEDTGRYGELNRIASLPGTLYFELKQKGIIDKQNDPNGVKFKKWLRDPDNRFFRTKLGYV